MRWKSVSEALLEEGWFMPEFFFLFLYSLTHWIPVQWLHTWFYRLKVRIIYCCTNRGKKVPLCGGGRLRSKRRRRSNSVSVQMRKRAKFVRFTASTSKREEIIKWGPFSFFSVDHVFGKNILLTKWIFARKQTAGIRTRSYKKFQRRIRLKGVIDRSEKLNWSREWLADISIKKKIFARIFLMGSRS